MTSELVHAIVGCGAVARAHATAFGGRPDVRLGWACDVDLGRAHELAAAHDIARTTASLDVVLADPAVTSLSLATPSHLHAPLARRAVAAGKAVLVEKPLALGAAAAARLVAEAEARGVLLVVVAQHRFDPLVGRVSRFLRAGGLGRPALWRADLECRRDPAYWRESPWRGRRAEAGGAALLTLGHHLLDLLLWLGGAPVRGTAELANSPEAAIDSEDTAAGVLALGAAATPATIAVTAAAGARWRPRLEALGTEAAIALDVGYPARLVRLDLASTAAETRWHESGEAGGKAVDEIGDAADAAPSYLDLHRRQADHFLARLRGRPGHPDAATGADAVAVLRAAEMLYRSRPSLP